MPVYLLEQDVYWSWVRQKLEERELVLLYR
jgi:hypothetical protein